MDQKMQINSVSKMESPFLLYSLNKMRHGIRLEKISKDAYDKVCKRNVDRLYLPYDEIKEPKRSTAGSAGYDFYAAEEIRLEPNETFITSTFIRFSGYKNNFDNNMVFLDAENYLIPMLCIYPKSGLGFKYQLMEANTVGIIDIDYQNTSTDDDTNEGNILIKFVNRGDKPVVIKEGDKMCQGIIQFAGTCANDDYTQFAERNGGIGSTGTK